eukprot:gene1144-1289_t
MLESERLEGGGGVGLRLRISQGIVRKHGGDLWVDTAAGSSGGERGGGRLGVTVSMNIPCSVNPDRTPSVHDLHPESSFSRQANARGTHDQLPSQASDVESQSGMVSSFRMQESLEEDFGAIPLHPIRFISAYCCLPLTTTRSDVDAPDPTATMLESERLEGGGGVGLRLRISQGIVRKHGGDIWVDTAADPSTGGGGGGGMGVRVTMCLPCGVDPNMDGVSSGNDLHIDSTFDRQSNCGGAPDRVHVQSPHSDVDKTSPSIGSAVKRGSTSDIPESKGNEEG